MADPTQMESAEAFGTDAEGVAARWAAEVEAAKKHVKKWQTSAKDIVRRFLDERKGAEADESRLNLFSANVQTQRSLMFGKEPKADVRRRFDDQDDQIGRVAAMMLERLLNTDVEDGYDGYKAAIGLALDDDLIVGLGAVRLRYEAEFQEQEEVPAVTHPETGEELAPAYTPEPAKTSEDVKTDYVHWRDLLWSPCRTWGELRWLGFKAYMTRDEVKKRFGADVARALPYRRGLPKDGDELQRADPWQRAEVWEIWSKDDRKVYWFCEGHPQILDEQEDPLGLDGFWPCPCPLVSNLTSEQFMPRPDFVLAQDLYNEIDYVSTRITLLERAVKVVGAYDKTNEGLKRLLTEGVDNELVPVDNWAMFADRGGVSGAISWLPVENVVAALDKLRDYRGELVKLSYEITGMSDIMRGSADSPNATATEQALKAKFASVRMQSRQDRFARFATEALRIKAEIILKHFDTQNIITRSNIEFTADESFIQQAVQALRDKRSKYRIEVKPESVSITDFAALRDERMQFLQGMTGFVQAAGPLMQQMPASAPFLLEMLRWCATGFRGADSIEGVLGQAVQAAKQAIANPPPQKASPEAEAKIQAIREKSKSDQMKAAVDIHKTATLAKIDVAKKQADLEHIHNRAQIEALVASTKLPAEEAAPPPGVAA